MIVFNARCRVMHWTALITSRFLEDAVEIQQARRIVSALLSKTMRCINSSNKKSVL